jgi:hypothetical protein
VTVAAQERVPDEGVQVPTEIVTFPGPPATDQVTVPVGDGYTLVTVAVQVTGVPMLKDDSAQDIVVVVCNFVTVSLVTPELAVLLASPPYAPAIVTSPAVVPVIVTEHVPRLHMPS